MAEAAGARSLDAPMRSQFGPSAGQRVQAVWLIKRRPHQQVGYRRLARLMASSTEMRDKRTRAGLARVLPAMRSRGSLSQAFKLLSL